MVDDTFTSGRTIASAIATLKIERAQAVGLTLAASSESTGRRLPTWWIVLPTATSTWEGACSSDERARR